MSGVLSRYLTRNLPMGEISKRRKAKLGSSLTRLACYKKSCHGVVTWGVRLATNGAPARITSYPSDP